jgi:hypothetical protein
LTLAILVGTIAVLVWPRQRTSFDAESETPTTHLSHRIHATHPPPVVDAGSPHSTLDVR